MPRNFLRDTGDEGSTGLVPRCLLLPGGDGQSISAGCFSDAEIKSSLGTALALGATADLTANLPLVFFVTGK
jgi:hypothetical protein